MINAIHYVMSEHTNNFSRLWSMSIAHMRKQTIRTSLGMGWIFLRDIIFFTVFILFRFLMAGGAEIEGMNFIVYLVTGLIPWFFMNEVINGGSNAILVNRSIINSIKFPITIIPTVEVVAILIKRLFTFLILFVVVFSFGYFSSFSIILFLYYFIAMFALMVLMNLVTSAYIAISNDFQQFYLAITRVLFYSMPIIWSFERISSVPWIMLLLKLNPMTYILIGFRDAFVHGASPSIVYSVYFWSMCSIMLLVGTYSQYTLREYYSDFM